MNSLLYWGIVNRKKNNSRWTNLVHRFHAGKLTKFFFNCQENGVVIVPPTLPLGKHQLLYKGKKLRGGPQASKHRLLRED